MFIPTGPGLGPGPEPGPLPLIVWCGDIAIGPLPGAGEVVGTDVDAVDVVVAELAEEDVQEDDDGVGGRGPFILTDDGDCGIPCRVAGESMGF